MEYTKGEWKAMMIQGQGIIHCKNITIAETYTINQEANAHLIAAAPDCYEGLKDALREICRMCVRLNPQHEGCSACEEMERSRLPLAKAEEK